MRWNIFFFLVIAWPRIYFSILYRFIFYSLHYILLKDMWAGVRLTWCSLRDRIVITRPTRGKMPHQLNPIQCINLPRRGIFVRPCGDCFGRGWTGSLSWRKTALNWLATRPGWMFHVDGNLWKVGLEMLRNRPLLDCFRSYFTQFLASATLLQSPHKTAYCFCSTEGPYKNITFQ